MIDHLIVFDNRAAAEIVLGSPLPARVVLNVGGENDESIRVILQDNPEVLAQGWYCIVCKPTLDPTLRDLPGNACRLIADRSRATDFLLYVAPDMPPEVLISARVEPTPAGSRYPFSATSQR